MGLARYKEKRNLKKSTEPPGGKSLSGELIFVVQQHDASRLHYDFRLEMGGVLKSWAIPKGPSTDSAIRRLAVMVEDHPYDYKNFEGTIPEGNYGAGTVIIWDRGTYEPVEKIKGKKSREKFLLSQLKKGELKLILHGQKLKGEWILVRTKLTENSWLLIKHQDRFASVKDITKNATSAVSGLTLDQLKYSASIKEETGKSSRPKLLTSKKIRRDTTGKISPARKPGKS